MSSNHWWDVGIWGIWWLGINFLILEGLAAFKHLTQRWFGWQVPWDTFSRSVWDVQTVKIIGTVASLGVIFVLSVLAEHLIRQKNISEGDKTGGAT